MVHQVFSNNVPGIRSLRSFLKQQRTALTVPCTLESTGAYHLLVALSLSEAGYRVNCVNPIITKKYMKATVRDAKSDKIDAKRIAELGYQEPALQQFRMTRENIAAKGVLSALDQLETLRQQLAAHIAHTQEMRQTLDCRPPGTPLRAGAQRSAHALISDGRTFL
jgi:transposase